MPDDTISEGEAERVVEIPKRITGQFRWEEGNDKNWYTEMQIEADEQLPLRLYGRFNPRTGNYTFIFFCGHLNLRRLDAGKRHHNPECDNVGPLHEHKWTDRFRDKWACEPPEMEPTDSMGTVFAKFLDECQITLDGRFVEPPPAYQGMLL